MVPKLYKPLADGHGWYSINLEHPMTFGTLVMELELKNAIVDDLHSFGLLGRGDFLEDEAGMSSKLGGTKPSMGATIELESVGSGVDETRGEQRQLESSPIPSVDRTKAITCCAEE
ncbi:hypothetical protein Ancab_027971 [Ancistrocladus abbreviatus]